MFNLLTSSGPAWRSLEERLGAVEKALEGLSSADIRPYDDRAVRQAIDALADQLQDQTLAIAEGIERVDRSERRVRSAVARAQKRLSDAGYEDEGVEAEAVQLQFLDGGTGKGVPPMHRDMEPAPRFDLASIFPGRWSAEHTSKLIGG
jgi:hypothetical protein